MKYVVIGMMLFVPVLAISCTRAPTETSKTGANQGQERTVAKVPVSGVADQTFSLSVPFDTVTVIQGGQTPIKIGINRGPNFGEDVTLKVSNLPSGVTMEKETSMIAKGDNDASLKLIATKEAALGDFTIKVTGQTSSSSADFSEEIKIKVTQE
ncbi:hypothetical protein SH449x_005079 [Pirellulaceae bacterium SH449]